MLFGSLSKWNIWALLALLWYLLFGNTGCSQQTATPLAQEQRIETPTKTDQESATQGSSVNIWVMNAPGSGGTPATPLDKLTAGDTELAKLLSQIDNPDGAAGKFQASSAGYTQGGIHITVTTGGTTPTLTGTTTGTSTANPAGTQNVSPNQEPRANVTAPIAF